MKGYLHFTLVRDLWLRLPSSQGEILIMKSHHCKSFNSWNEWSYCKRSRQALPTPQEIHLIQKSSCFWAWVVKGRHNLPLSTVEWQGHLGNFKRSFGLTPRLLTQSPEDLKLSQQRFPVQDECSTISNQRYPLSRKL